MKIDKLNKLYNETKTFLLDYANNKYGKCNDLIIVTPTIVQEFLDNASEFDLEEILSYTTPEIIAAMLAEKGTETEGASDLEDYINYVINKDED